MTKILNKRDWLMKTFCLDEKQFSLIEYWFKSEPSLDKNDNTPVAVIKDENKPPTKDNLEWVSIRVADAIGYARTGGFGIKVK